MPLLLHVLLPLVLITNERLVVDRKRLQALREREMTGKSISADDAAWMAAQFESYRVEAGQWDLLLRRVDEVPPSLALAQAAALLSFESAGQDPDDRTVYYFAGIDGARFKRPVEPGDQLVLDVALLRAKAGIYKFAARATVGGELAVEAELMCTMRQVG